MVNAPPASREESRLAGTQRIVKCYIKNMFEKILKQLISFDTSVDQSNLPLVEYVKKLLQDAGYLTETFGPKDKKNLFAFRMSENPRIILATHSDTVVASNNWQTDPLKLSKKQDKLYGLGVSDVKGILAANLDLALKSDQNNLALLISFNEETDFAGANLIGNEIIKSKDVVIVGEPTSNKAIFDAKGAAAYRISFIGKSAHGSQPERGNSAIMALSKFVNELADNFEEMFVTDGSTMFKNSNQTLNFGVISGGDAINKVAEKAELTLELRFADEKYLKKFDKLLNKLKRASKVRISIDNIMTIYPFSSSKKVREKLNKISVRSALGVSYCCEANVYAKLTDNIFIFGPGSINQAHKVNEFIKISEIQKYQKSLKKIIRSF